MRVLLTFLIITALAFGAGVVYNSHRQAAQAQNELSQERYQRMVAEEGLEKAQSQVSSLTLQLDKSHTKLKNLEARLTLADSKASELEGKVSQFEQLKAALEQQVTELQGRLGDTPDLANKTATIPGLE